LDRRKVVAPSARRSPRIKHERSAGGLVLKRENGTYSGLLIGRNTPRIWSLPKGHVEVDETIEEAAVREVREETAVQATIVSKLSDIRYWFYSRDVKHSKIVHFFLMRYLTGKPKPQEGEVDETAWAKLDDMPEIMTHRNERRLIEMARTIVAEKPAVDLGF
jgi:8-oxo-dGTP pyrophosphatase MutT (NUDIX family)